MNKAIVIGSGIAGLASALRLRAKGLEVEVFEANNYPGGKLHAFESKGFRFDYGPSLFTMPQYVDELFQLFEEDPRKYFNYSRRESICNYFWEDGTTFTAHSDVNQFINDASKAFNEHPETIKSYLSNSADKYDLTAKLFLEKSLHKASTYFSKEALKGVMNSNRLDLTKSLDKVNKKYFDNPKLIQLFNRYATYNGSNPYRTPGIMSLIPQLEMRFGTYYPHGGMHAISQSLFLLAESRGIKFHFNSKVEKVIHESHEVRGVRAADKIHEADKVICNMDIFSAYQTILKDVKKPKRVLKQERSSSALIFYWGVNRTFKELDLHNIFFAKNYKKEFDLIFKEKTITDDPTVYINITSKGDPDHAPPGCENWFVMINTPGNKGQDWEKIKREAKQNILMKLSGILKKEIAPMIVTEEILDPLRIENDTLSHEGSLYGTSSNSKFAAFLRHPNFSSSIRNLFFCGGSAHPGGGIPLCLLSAKIVADFIPHS
ncbi:MAG: phytoene desaturase [Ekhidna sp.]|nr:phytoene desaturase [Ekhidna sp.]MBC6425284.1 phytoene desaturase [Ekhidna sp.]